MNTYQSKINELRAVIDLEINEKEDICLSSPELVEKALMIEQELFSKK